MSEEPKKKKSRRSPDEVAADYEARAARNRWAGVRDGLGMMEKAKALLEESIAACGTKITKDAAEAVKTAVEAVGDAAAIVDALVPQEAK